MSKERERKRDEIKKKGIPLADIGSDVIWDDPKLKVPFSSNPFISRMKGSAILNQTLSYGLYYNELTKKWTPLTSASITESLIKARFYPITPDDLVLLSDNSLRSDKNQNLMVVNKDVPLLVSDLTFLDTTKLSVKDVDIITELAKLNYLDTTKLSVKDADNIAKLELIRIINDAIKIQTDKLNYLDTTKLSVKDASLNTTMEKLNYLETTKLSVKDADNIAKLELIRIINDAIKTQTDKLQFDGSNNLKCIIG